MAGLRVLVVDDELSIRLLLTALLKRLGHIPEAVPNGSEALNEIERSKFDLVLSDLDMPGLKGDALAREIKKKWQDLPVVLVTGSQPAELPPEIDGILFKPFSIDELATTIASVT